MQLSFARNVRGLPQYFSVCLDVEPSKVHFGIIIEIAPYFIKLKYHYIQFKFSPLVYWFCIYESYKCDADRFLRLTEHIRHAWAPSQQDLILTTRPTPGWTALIHEPKSTDPVEDTEAYCKRRPSFAPGAFLE